MSAAYWRKDEARRVLAKLAASGLTAAEFARRAGIAEKRLRYWRKQLSAPKPSLAMVRVGLRAAPEEARSSRSPALEVVTGHRVVRVPAGFDAETLGRLLAVLDASC